MGESSTKFQSLQVSQSLDKKIKKFAEIDLPNSSVALVVGPLEGSWEGVFRALEGVGGKETGFLRCSSGAVDLC